MTYNFHCSCSTEPTHRIDSQPSKVELISLYSLPSMSECYFRCIRPCLKAMRNQMDRCGMCHCLQHSSNRKSDSIYAFLGFDKSPLQLISSHNFPCQHTVHQQILSTHRIDSYQSKHIMLSEPSLTTICHVPSPTGCTPRHESSLSFSLPYCEVQKSWLPTL